MRRFASIVRLRVRSVFLRARVERELDDELRYHLEREIEENIAAGICRDEARLAALRSISDIEQRKEECRDMRGVNRIDNIRKDIRFALRQLRKDFEFTITAMLMLGLGISAAVAIFAFVDAALIKPLPYKDPGRLVGVYEKLEPQYRYSNLSWLDYLDWKKLNSTLDSLDVYQGYGFTLTAKSGAEPVPAARVSDGFFRTLGVRPALGRDFYSGEDRPGAPRAAILSYSGWKNRFAGKKEIIGQPVVLNRKPYTVVGVLPEGFHFAPVGQAEFWVPLQPESECDKRRSCHHLYGVGRLKPGVGVSAALAEFVSIAKQLEKQYPDTNRDQGANVRRLSDAIVGEVRPILLVLLAGAGLLLLISTVDVIGLLIVRSESRWREIAVRAAVGASRGRLLAQFITEAIVLVGAGLALGVVGAHFTIQLLTRMLSEDMLARMPFLIGLTWNWRLGMFVVVVAALCAILFSVAPNVRLWAAGLQAGLAEGSRGSAGTVWHRLGSRLVVVELATAVVLLVGAGLLVKSLHNLLQVNLGLKPERLVTLDVAAPEASYGEDPKAAALARTILERARELPGVVSADLSANGAPLGHNGNTIWVRILGRPWNGDHLDVPEREITPGYFSTIGARMISGRFFEESDDISRPPVAIVNQAFVRKYFPNGAALGQRLARVSTKRDPIEIIGVVADIRQGPLDDEIPPVIYRPFNQNTETYFNLVVQTSQEQAAILPDLIASIRRLDPEIVTIRGTTMKERVEQSPSAYIHRSTAWLVGGFAALALVLSVVGLYGVVAYSVSRRTREIGVRMALGAQSRTVYGMILREAGWLAVLGIGLGLVGAAASATLTRTLLFGVSPWDPVTMAEIAVVLAISSLAATIIPARRAASVNPVEALRSE